MTSRSKSSGRWVAEHESDEYVLRARREGWRSRAVYKLQEVQEREGLIRPGMTVVDLGAAPGAWSQYAAHLMRGRGQIVAVDILPMDPLPEVATIQGDFTETETLEALNDALGAEAADLVLSDMAPNLSGMAAVDQPRSMLLAELALEFCRERLRPGGDFLTKLFQGEGSDEFIRECRGLFGTVKVRKPRASRSRSREVYLLARNKRLL